MSDTTYWYPPGTSDEAVFSFEAGEWQGMSERERFERQLHCAFLFMPFHAFHAAAEATLNRPVFTHEFAFADRLRAELNGAKPDPFGGLIDSGKPVILVEVPKP